MYTLTYIALWCQAEVIHSGDYMSWQSFRLAHLMLPRLQEACITA